MFCVRCLKLRSWFRHLQAASCRCATSVARGSVNGPVTRTGKRAPPGRPKVHGSTWKWSTPDKSEKWQDFECPGVTGNSSLWYPRSKVALQGSLPSFFPQLCRGGLHRVCGRLERVGLKLLLLYLHLHAHPPTSAPGLSLTPGPLQSSEHSVSIALKACCPMWQRRAQSRCRCGSGELSPGGDVAGASPVPMQMWAVVSPVPVETWEGAPPTQPSLPSAPPQTAESCFSPAAQFRRSPPPPSATAAAPAHARVSAHVHAHAARARLSACLFVPAWRARKRLRERVLGVRAHAQRRESVPPPRWRENERARAWGRPHDRTYLAPRVLGADELELHAPLPEPELADVRPHFPNLSPRLCACMRVRVCKCVCVCV